MSCLFGCTDGTPLVIRSLSRGLNHQRDETLTDVFLDLFSLLVSMHFLRAFFLKTSLSHTGLGTPEWFSCLGLGMCLMQSGGAARSLSYVLYFSTGGEMEGKEIADEVLRVAPLWALSWLWGAWGWSPEYSDSGRGTVCHCGECGPPKWHLHEEHSPLPKTHCDWVCTPKFVSSYCPLPSQQEVGYWANAGTS